jgi:hypothetical protein
MGEKTLAFAIKSQIDKKKSVHALSMPCNYITTVIMIQLSAGNRGPVQPKAASVITRRKMTPAAFDFNKADF